MAYKLVPFIFAQYFDDDGVPLNAGTISFYAADSDDFQNTYQDADGNTANTNPVVLDASGRCGQIFLQPEVYSVVLKDSLGNVIDTASVSAPDESETTGSFTMTLTGVTATITGTCRWTATDTMVFLEIPYLAGTSNTTAATLTGLPAALYPARTQTGPCDVKNSTGTLPGVLSLSSTTGIITVFYKVDATSAYTGTWPNTLSKEVGTGSAFIFSYRLT